ncbi:hypothetical protein KIPE111705_18745 [Kibdelosporangium persicum]|uniref:Mce-associated membrane protein n=1 Tax=Kibdelosporangium persicum TaxID=2698649 RepID=A0ABX2FE95_9PSEU|nr:hypothetical protein [Kibdelosporangium persicum]NRN69714.1 Mce-associated membrane protein [Kibdelosporangium persicum]
MPPPRRRPATPPSRRPKVAGLHRRPSEEEATPSLDVPVTGEESANGHQTAEPEPPRPQDPVDRQPFVEDTADQDTVWSEPVPEPAKPDEPAASEEPASAEAPSEKAPSEKATEEPDEDSAEAEPERQRPNLTVPVILVVVALLLGGLGFWFTQKVSDARVGSGNEVLADVNATKDVVGAANTAVTAVLSYKFDDMPGATKRAKEYLAGEAVDQYDKSMKALEADIQNQKLQVVVNPVNVGVVRLAGDDARVLVFADQVGTRADKQPSGGPTQFAMDMRRVDGKWKIVKLDFFENPR